MADILRKGEEERIILDPTIGTLNLQMERKAKLNWHGNHQTGNIRQSIGGTHAEKKEKLKRKTKMRFV